MCPITGLAVNQVFQFKLTQKKPDADEFNSVRIPLEREEGVPPEREEGAPPEREEVPPEREVPPEGEVPLERDGSVLPGSERAVTPEGEGKN